jgi:hypothetical protein
VYLLISAFCFGVKCRDEGAIPHFFAPLDDLPSAATVAADCTDGSISSLALSLRIDGPSSSSRLGVVDDTIQYRIAAAKKSIPIAVKKTKREAAPSVKSPQKSIPT